MGWVEVGLGGLGLVGWVGLGKRERRGRKRRGGGGGGRCERDPMCGVRCLLFFWVCIVLLFSPPPPLSLPPSRSRSSSSSSSFSSSSFSLLPTQPLHLSTSPSSMYVCIVSIYLHLLLLLLLFQKAGGKSNDSPFQPMTVLSNHPPSSSSRREALENSGSFIIEHLEGRLTHVILQQDMIGCFTACCLFWVGRWVGR